MESELLLRSQTYHKKKFCSANSYSECTIICLLLLLSATLSYFVMVGLGLGISQWFFQDTYNMTNGCTLKNQSNCNLLCYFDNSKHFYGGCLVTGFTVMCVLFAALLIFIVYTCRGARCPQRSDNESNESKKNCCYEGCMETYCSMKCLTSYFCGLFSEVATLCDNDEMEIMIQ